ncbi:hypothetical protein ACJMK2_005877, partial [Sinanodonta woodiana]
RILVSIFLIVLLFTITISLCNGQWFGNGYGGNGIYGGFYGGGRRHGFGNGGFFGGGRGYGGYGGRGF